MHKRNYCCLKDMMEEVLNSRIFEVAAVLKAFYYIEHNIRLENDLETGFYSSRPWGLWSRDQVASFTFGEIICESDESFTSRMTDNTAIDWSCRHHGDTPGEAVSKVFWDQIKEYPMLTKTIADVDDHQIPLSETLLKVHRSGMMFRIEMIWDDGFYLYLVNPNIKPTRPQIDNHNDKLRSDYEHGLISNPRYLASPANDVIEKIPSVWPIAEINNWFLKKLSTYNSSKLFSEGH